MSPLSSSSSADVHLVVIIHGLWGSPDHVSYLARSLVKTNSSSTDDTRLDILIPTTIQWTNTYDGIDYCAEHVAQEIDQRRQELASDGYSLTKFSVVGYSLGGLIGRFLIGLLHSRQPSFFDKIEPMSFSTFASPWIGMPRYKGILSLTIHFFGSRLLSRTGNQLYLTDKYHQLPSPNDATTGHDSNPNHDRNKKNKASNKKFPLLSILAHPDTNFYKALLSFKVVNIYANSINDRTVPFVTGAIEKFDLFQIFKELSRNSNLINDQTDLSELEILQLAGLDIKFSPDCTCLIDDVQSIGAGSHSESLDELISKQESSPKGTRIERWKRNLPKLPFFLRPSTYPFRAPLNYFAAGLLPVIAPIFLIYILSSFCYQSYQSSKRIKNYSSGDLDHHSSRLRRVGLLQELEQDLIEDIAGIGNQTSFENNIRISHQQPTLSIDRDQLNSPPNSDPKSINGDSSHHQDTSERSHLIRAKTHDQHAHQANSMDTPNPIPITNDRSNNFPPRRKGTRYIPSSVLQDINIVKHDLGLSKLQINMLEDLNRLPNLIKYFGFLDGIPNAHGAIIYRAEGLSDRRGKKIVYHWAERFVL